jgi:hypothetical protein
MVPMGARVSSLLIVRVLAANNSEACSIGTPKKPSNRSGEICKKK